MGETLFILIESGGERRKSSIYVLCQVSGASLEKFWKAEKITSILNESYLNNKNIS